MTGPTGARLAAFETLRAVRDGALADHAFDAAAQALPQRERAFAQELVYGTLRLRARLDHIISAHSERPFDRVEPDVLDVLRLGAYQLTELDGVPPYAAVSQAVELSRRVTRRGARAAGFINAVLQGLRRAAGQSTFPRFETDPIAYLSTWGSHPRWLVERWVARFGADGARRLVETNNLRPRLYLRLLGDVEASFAALADAGIAATRPPLLARVAEIAAADVQRALDLVPAIVQDPAAGLVAAFVHPPAAARVLDLAAAPGGKALALTAADTAPPHYLVAADASARRLGRLRQNVERLARPRPAGLGPLPLGMVVADGREPPFRPLDVVLLDAPCTGTGTLRRHPDGRWRLQPSDLTALIMVQAELLRAAAPLVAPGGLLVYASCSLEPEENEAQVTSFLLQHPQFHVEPAALPDPAMLHEDGTLRMLPQQYGYDGAFAARLRREA